jgi:ACR3 family arsenite transporter
MMAFSKFKDIFSKDSTLRKAWSSLSFTDKILPIAIILAIVLGVLLSVYVPNSRKAFDGVQIVGVSVPLAIGLIIMMIPPLCKVEWEKFHKLIIQKTYLKQIIISLILNWIVCPFLMFGLAWLTLFDKPEYRVGIIMIGLARCIAMVLVWNEIADGDSNLCAILVLINSLLQIVLYAPYQIFFCYVITGDYNSTNSSNISYSLVSKSVAFFLGIPLAIGLIIRLLSFKTIGIKSFEKNLLPFISPWAFIGLIYTIIVIFIERGDAFIKDIRTALRCFVPLILYFGITWFGTFFLLRWIFGRNSPNLEVFQTGDDNEKETLLCGCEEEIIDGSRNVTNACSANYAETITQTFTAASNNFELSLAIAISIYGSGSNQSIAATFGPLLEVPILLILCFVAQLFKFKFQWSDIPDHSS